ncbi:zinc ribbon domain-containing protein [Williamsia sterculiae]|nr:zinc ribbon domain-containing protein [Williamsia sterculiae]
MADRPDLSTCPRCGGRSIRTFVGARLGVGNTTAMRLQDATRATGDRPDVVSRPPTRISRGRHSTNPLHRTLPRP